MMTVCCRSCICCASIDSLLENAWCGRGLSGRLHDAVADRKPRLRVSTASRRLQYFDLRPRRPVDQFRESDQRAAHGLARLGRADRDAHRVRYRAASHCEDFRARDQYTALSRLRDELITAPPFRQVQPRERTARIML